MRVFDVDDPSSSAADSDDETEPADNKGIVSGALSVIVPTVLRGGVAHADATFAVSLIPGDNYRFVAALSPASIVGVQGRQADAGAGVYDATGTAIPENGNPASMKATPLLTVWRRLHVEVDSMAAVPITGLQKNSVQRFLQEFNPLSTDVAVNGDRDLVDLPNGLDDSPRLDSAGAGTAVGNGRFEGGSMKVGGATPQLFPLVGNGTAFVRVAGAFAPNFSLTQGGQPTLTGTVSALVAAERFASLSPAGGATVTAAYVGGTLIIGGQSMVIDAVLTGNALKLDRIPLIPVELSDDDDNTLLPVPVTQSAAIQSYTAEFNRVYNEAYVEVDFDGGFSPTNNKSNLPFVLNMFESNNTDALLSLLRQPSALESHSSRADDFWVAYFQIAYQSHPLTLYDPLGGRQLRGDGDPDAEASALTGVADREKRGAFVFIEETRELPRLGSSSTTARTAAHEVAHQFDVPDKVAAGGMMGPDIHGTSPRFLSDALNRIRNSTASPGRR